MLAFRLLRRKKSLPSVSNNAVSSSFISRITKQPKIFKISAVSLYLAPWRGLEPPVYRLGGGCVIHYATRAYSLVSIRISIFSGCSIPRLGGGCSIQLSYGDISNRSPLKGPVYFIRIPCFCQEKSALFLCDLSYTVQ